MEYKEINGNRQKGLEETVGNKKYDEIRKQGKPIKKGLIPKLWQLVSQLSMPWDALGLHGLQAFLHFWQI